MMNNELVISILLFTGLMLLFGGIFALYTFRSRSRNIVDKIKGAGTVPVPEKPAVEDNDSKWSFGKFISSLGSKFTPEKGEELSAMRKTLIQAGYRRHNAPAIFIGYRFFFAGILPVIFSLIKVFFIMTFTPTLLMALSVLLALIGYLLPNLWLRIRTAQRKEKILEGFPDALDLMVVCVESGMNLDAALSRVGHEMKIRNKVLAEEFRLLSLELRAGKPRRDALRNLATRTGLDDVASLMTLLIQTDKFGTSVAQALRVHSESMRTKRYQRAEEVAAKLPVKLVFPLILFILPSLFVVIVGPAVIRVIRIFFPLMSNQ